jgi:hypothetical protein
MNLSTVLQKAWQMLWHYRALWLLGAVLALVGANTIYPGYWPDRDNDDQWTKIKMSDTVTIRVPGADVTIDLTAPEGVRIITKDGTSWREFRDMVDVLNREASINLWPILIEFAVILAGLLLLGVIARYIVETAVIRMVYEAEATGKRLGVRGGLRRGVSFRAGRLFLLDLAVGVLAALAVIAMFGLAVAPVLLAIGSHEAILIAAGLGTIGLLALAGCLWLAASAVLSLVLQTIRRACVLEDQSLLTSIRQGVTMTKHHLKEVGLLWLVWMGIRLVWAPVGALILILLTPVLLLTILAGVALGGVPAALVTAITSLFMRGATPWIMGALAGIPIFIVVMASPMLFVSGLVEIYKSCIWTLAYRDLRAMERLVQAPVSRAPLAPARGAAD